MGRSQEEFGYLGNYWQGTGNAFFLKKKKKKEADRVDAGSLDISWRPNAYPRFAFDTREVALRAWVRTYDNG